MNKWCEKEIEEMLEQVAEANNAEEVSEVFERILTPREINDAARRLAIIKMLEQGESYSSISMRLGVSSGVISKISVGSGYGFRRSDYKALAKIKPKEKAKLPHLVESKIRYKGTPTYKISFK